ncbi:MAG: hypothetical protein KDC46_00505 [Thermoleophilia bacterium]|nr:hypothetical protein [Thermoleophilia bacterium]
MRQVAIENIEPGMVTARHVYPPGESGGIPLLAAEVRISEVILKKLHRSGITSLMIDDEFGEGIENNPPLDDATRQQAIGVLKDAYQGMGSESGRLTHEQVQAMEGVMSRILVEVASRKNLLLCLSDLNLFGGDKMQRALDTCVIGTAIGREFFNEHGWKDFRGQRREDGVEDRMVKLGVGLLLQDIGMLAVPDAIREKHGVLTADERKIMQQHPLLGLDLLEGGELSPLSKVAIAQHHERYDGSGYPRGIAGDELHDHGQIAALAEAYVSLCDHEVDDGEAFPPHEAYKLIVQSRGRLFRPEIVDAFAAAIAPYGPTTSVQLSDGRYGIVVRNNAGSPTEPVVRVTHDQHGMLFSPPMEVDLSASGGSVRIERATGGLPGDRNIGPDWD